ncbi:bZIP transcription factor 44-like [Cornus florida]|uniref:bZIP transcription factor 44-like n=1 Tax=Cornus florida TaxID=4283 RepID=UPI002899FBCC|nr:bZIP transcription factor 44-like [Cornus florida]
MASSSKAASGSTQLHNSGSEDDLQQTMDQRKRKRMISNRESARRSRMRKQKHLDDLMAQLGQLRNENNHILTNVNVTTQLHVNIEAENSVLRAQMAELTHRLDSLNEIINSLNSPNNDQFYETEDAQIFNGGDFLNPWNLMYVHQPIMASADMFMY